MAKNFNQILWSPFSEKDLDDILAYYLEKSPDKAYDHILQIINDVEQLVFSEQWQIDEYDPSCRRIIAHKKFRVLYKVLDDVILITRIYPTQMNPDNMTA